MKNFHRNWLSLSLAALFINLLAFEEASSLELSIEEWPETRADFLALTAIQKEEIRQPLINELRDGFLDFIEIAKATELLAQYEAWYRGIHGTIPEAGHEYWATPKMAELTQQAAILHGDELRPRYQEIIRLVNDSFLNPTAAALLREGACLFLKEDGYQRAYRQL